jgi:hypothetical protein
VGVVEREQGFGQWFASGNFGWWSQTANPDHACILSRAPASPLPNHSGIIGPFANAPARTALTFKLQKYGGLINLDGAISG